MLLNLRMVHTFMFETMGSFDLYSESDLIVFLLFFFFFHLLLVLVNGHGTVVF